MNNALLVVWLIGFYLAVSFDAYLMSKIMPEYDPKGKYDVEFVIYIAVAIYLIATGWGK